MLLCGIIKPHALPRSEEILTTLKTANVLVQQTSLITYTPELVEILYDHMTTEARIGISRELIGQEGLALLVRVPSIECFLELVGRESDPRVCKAGTIRAQFGVHEPPIEVGRELWWNNAFHRPINMREAARDLLHIFTIELADM